MNTTIFRTDGIVYLSLNNLQLFNSDNILIQDQQISYTDENLIKTKYGVQIKYDGIQVQNLRSTFSLITLSFSYYYLKNSSFFNVTSTSLKGSILYLMFSQIDIQDSNFTQNSAIYGGSLFLENSDSSLIDNCNFTHNQAVLKGGAIYLRQSKILFKNNKIIYNKAQIGGGIYFFSFFPQFNENYKYNVTEENELVSYKAQINYINQQTNNNIAVIYGDNIASPFLKFQITSIKTQEDTRIIQLNSTYDIMEFRSGDSLNITIIVNDFEDKPLKIDKKVHLQQDYKLNDEISKIRIQIKQFDEIINSTNQQKIDPIFISNTVLMQLYDYDESTFSFSTQSPIKIIGRPNYSNMTQVYVESMFSKQYQSDVSQYMYLNFHFRNCSQGEVQYSRGLLKECVPCPEGFYSFENEQLDSIDQCQRCPEQAANCFKNQIQLKQGYWRSNNQSDHIIYCSQKPSNCIGTTEGNAQSCKEGLIGPLCQTCDIYGEYWGEKYMRRESFSCIKCSQASSYRFFIPVGAFALILISYIVISVNQTIKISKNQTYQYYFTQMRLICLGNSCIKNRTNFYLKQLMHYMQIIVIVNEYDFTFIPQIFMYIPDILSSPLKGMQYNFDCILNEISKNSIHIVYVRAFWCLIIPFILIIILSLVYIVLVSFKVVKKNKFYLFNGMIFLLIFMQPNVLSDLIGVISCRNIDDNLYISSQLTLECYTQDHIHKSLMIILPGIFFWMILMPSVIIFQLNKRKNCLNNYRVRLKFGFLYQDFKQNYFYWEFIKSLIKILIVFVNQFFFDFTYNRLIIIAFILLLYKLLLENHKPYQVINFNRIDNLIAMIHIIILNLNILLKGKFSTLSELDVIGEFISALIHNIFLFTLMVCIILNVVSEYYPKQNYIIRNFLKKKIPMLFKKLDLQKPINVFRVFKNWKKAHKIMKQIKNNIQENNSQIQQSIAQHLEIDSPLKLNSFVISDSIIKFKSNTYIQKQENKLKEAINQQLSSPQIQNKIADQNQVKEMYSDSSEDISLDEDQQNQQVKFKGQALQKGDSTNKISKIQISSNKTIVSSNTSTQQSYYSQDKTLFKSSYIKQKVGSNFNMMSKTDSILNENISRGQIGSASLINPVDQKYVSNLLSEKKIKEEDEKNKWLIQFSSEEDEESSNNNI